MKATVYHGPRDVRVERVADPRLEAPTDAIVRVTRAAICGSDLWFYRGVTQWEPGDRTGHEFVGIVEETGADVRTVRKGDYVVAPFVSSDGTCEYCREGLQTSCIHMSNWGDDANGGQAEAVRVPFADGTLVKLSDGIAENESMLASALTLTDVMGTGHHGIVTANTRTGGTVVVIGDGAVGLCAVLSASRVLDAEHIVAVGHNEKRLNLAKEFGATHVFNSHDDGVGAAILELTKGGSPSVVEAVGNQSSMELAIEIARPGGTISFVGVPHNVKELPLRPIFLKNVSLHGAIAPVRAYIPTLMRYVADRSIDPSRVFFASAARSRCGGLRRDGRAARDQGVA